MIALILVGGVVNSIGVWDRHMIPDIHIIEAGDIDSVFRWITPPAVMGVNAANRAKIMFRSLGAPLIESEVFRSLQNLQFFNGNTCHHRPALAADGAVSAPQLLKIAVKLNFKMNRAAMAVTYFVGHSKHSLESELPIRKPTLSVTYHVCSSLKSTRHRRVII